MSLTLVSRFGNCSSHVCNLLVRCCISSQSPCVLHCRQRYLPRYRFLSSDIRCESLEDLAYHMKCGDFKNVVVMAGAGMGTPSGLRDFRTPGCGLYDNLKDYNLPYKEALFDIKYFMKEPAPFFTFAHRLYKRLGSGKHRPNIAHYFVRLLQEKDLLLRLYTQNVDGLDRLAGISEDLLVEAHGTSSTATCRVCQTPYKKADIMESILKGEIPRCLQPSCNGIVKPDIVFFGEQLPAKFWNFVEDLPKADLLFVIGTSLEVKPFSTIAEVAPHGIPRILFNLNTTGPFVKRPRANDVIVEGDIAETFKALSVLLGWAEELKQLMESSEKEMYITT